MRYRYLYYLLLLISAFIFRDFTPANELKYISIADEAPFKAARGSRSIITVKFMPINRRYFSG